MRQVRRPASSSDRLGRRPHSITEQPPNNSIHSASARSNCALADAHLRPNTTHPLAERSIDFASASARSSGSNRTVRGTLSR
jgi:hypothetical protein